MTSNREDRPRRTRYGERKRKGVIYDLTDFLAVMRSRHPDVEFLVEDDAANNRHKMTVTLASGERFTEAVEMRAKYEGGALMRAYEKIKPRLAPQEAKHEQ